MERSKKELIEGIMATWVKYGEIENPNYTSSDMRKADDILDDIKRLTKDD